MKEIYFILMGICIILIIQEIRMMKMEKRIKFLMFELAYKEFFEFKNKVKKDVE